MPFVEVTCPRCTSPRVQPLDATHYRCGHCQATFIRDEPKPAPVPRQAPAVLPALPPPTLRIRVAVAVSLIVGGVLTLGGIAFVALKLRSPDVPVEDTPVPRPGVVAPAVSAAEHPAAPPPSAAIKAARSASSAGSRYWLIVYENTGSSVIGNPTARVSLFDEKGARVLEQTGYADTKHLEPHETTPILVLAMNPPRFAREEVAAVSPEAPSGYDAAQVAVEVSDFAEQPQWGRTQLS